MYRNLCRGHRCCDQASGVTLAVRLQDLLQEIVLLSCVLQRLHLADAERIVVTKASWCRKCREPHACVTSTMPSSMSMAVVPGQQLWRRRRSPPHWPRSWSSAVVTSRQLWPPLPWASTLQRRARGPTPPPSCRRPAVVGPPQRGGPGKRARQLLVLMPVRVMVRDVLWDCLEACTANRSTAKYGIVSVLLLSRGLWAQPPARCHCRNVGETVGPSSRSFNKGI